MLTTPLVPQHQSMAEWSCWIMTPLPRNAQLNIYWTIEKKMKITEQFTISLAGEVGCFVSVLLPDKLIHVPDLSIPDNPTVFVSLYVECYTEATNTWESGLCRYYRTSSGSSNPLLNSGFCVLLSKWVLNICFHAFMLCNPLYTYFLPIS